MMQRVCTSVHTCVVCINVMLNMYTDVAVPFLSFIVLGTNRGPTDRIQQIKKTLNVQGVRQ